ncbi:unnamed protein product [Linum trigynum]|uniref:Uncharacterized protein n=1 Tax=Linum trigynum TaxID=586398 RepID=A0AAV2G0A0_9ROSI
MKRAGASAKLLAMVVLSITLSSASAARSLAETLTTSSSLTPLPVLDVNGKVSCKVDCKDVGIYVDENGGRRLALVDKDGDPFVVKFVRAD